MKRTKLLKPFSLAHDVLLRNRIVMAPMTTWAGNDDGTVSDEEEAYYRLRVKDVGLVPANCAAVPTPPWRSAQRSRGRPATIRLVAHAQHRTMRAR